MHVCQLCNKNPATVHLTDIQNNVKREVHMCEQCAAKKGFAIGQSISLPDLAPAGSAVDRVIEGAQNDLACDVCGITWSEFRARGRFGCAHDYDVFRERLNPLLQDIHARAERHVGKSPRSGGEQGRLQRELMDCRRRLRDAVEREEYEAAAKLRDELRTLEGRLYEGN